MTTRGQTNTMSIEGYAAALGALMGRVEASMARVNSLPPATPPVDPQWAAALHEEMEEFRAVNAAVSKLTPPPPSAWHSGARSALGGVARRGGGCAGRDALHD